MFINLQALKVQALKKDTGFQDRQRRTITWDGEDFAMHNPQPQTYPNKHLLQHNAPHYSIMTFVVVVPIYVSAARIKGEEVLLPCSKGPSQMNRRCLWHKGGIELFILSRADYGTFWLFAAQALPAKPEKHISIIYRAIQNYHISQWNLIWRHILSHCVLCSWAKKEAVVTIWPGHKAFHSKKNLHHSKNPASESDVLCEWVWDQKLKFT